MRVEDLFEMYIREREYQKEVFGDYSDNPALNFASFITFLDLYLQKVKNSYCDKWDENPPAWIMSTPEFKSIGMTPSNAYEHLIKLFVLAGAALEQIDVNPTEWRKDGINPKWK